MLLHIMSEEGIHVVASNVTRETTPSGSVCCCNYCKKSHGTFRVFMLLQRRSLWLWLLLLSLLLLLLLLFWLLVIITVAPTDRQHDDDFGDDNDNEDDRMKR